MIGDEALPAIDLYSVSHQVHGHIHVLEACGKHDGKLYVKEGDILKAFDELERNPDSLIRHNFPDVMISSLLDRKTRIFLAAKNIFVHCVHFRKWILDALEETSHSFPSGPPDPAAVAALRESFSTQTAPEAVQVGDADFAKKLADSVRTAHDASHNLISHPYMDIERNPNHQPILKVSKKLLYQAVDDMTVRDMPPLSNDDTRNLARFIQKASLMFHSLKPLQQWIIDILKRHSSQSSKAYAAALKEAGVTID